MLESNKSGRLKFKLVPVSKKLELGSSSKVHCRAQGSPAPLVRWFKEDHRANASWPPPDRIKDVNGTLYFHRVEQDDSSYYTCTAANEQGTINATVFLDVIGMLISLFQSEIWNDRAGNESSHWLCLIDSYAAFYPTA